MLDNSHHDARQILERIFTQTSDSDAGLKNGPQNGRKPSYYSQPTSPSDTAIASIENNDTHASTQRISDEHDKLPPPVLPNTHLPPTPPSHSNEHIDSAGLGSLPLLIDSCPDLRASNMQVRTPSNQRTPPTPEVTPPTTRNRLTVPRPPLLHYASSQAESFVTAQEDMYSNASQSRSYLQLPVEQDPRTPEGLSPQDGFVPQYPSPGYAASTPTQEDSSDTDSVQTPRKKKERNEFPLFQYMDSDGGSVSANEEPHTNGVDEAEARLEHNHAEADESEEEVQISPPALQISRSRNGQRTPQASPRPVVPDGQESAAPTRDETRALSADGQGSERGMRTPKPLPRARISSDRARPLSGQSQAAHANGRDFLQAHLQDERSHRLSAASGTSTVVEVLVYSSPPPKRRALRHAGRNIALSENPGLPGSKRVSSDSAAIRQHQLRHIRSPLSQSGDLTNGWAEQPKKRVVSNPENGVRHTLRASHHSSPSPNLASFRSNAKAHFVANRTKATDDDGLLSDTDDSRQLWDHLALNNFTHQRYESFTDDNALPQPLYVARRSMQTSNDRPAVVAALASRSGWNRAAHDSDLQSPEASPEREPGLESPDRTRLNEARDHSRFGLPSPTNDQTSPKGDEDTKARTSSEHLYPSSRRRSLEPRSDHAAARHLYANSTPMSLSQFSDRTDALEVREARAVNIYPHNNRSILLVQQHPSRVPGLQPEDPMLPYRIDEHDQTSERDMAQDAEPALQAPVFNAIVIPDTPPKASKSRHPGHVDSPLTNPRAAPQPPAIKFIPPTPSSDLDRQLTLEDEATPNTFRRTMPGEGLPVRRLSLVQKARRYSESFMQPLFISRRRRYSRRSQQLPTRDTNLHPFWRPRGFWDEFGSETEEDDYFDDQNEPYEPLPRGGDTSDPEPDDLVTNGKFRFPRNMSVRMAGFRGTGGFLLGNSLGMTRHGTNNRRHYVEPSHAASRGKSGGRYYPTLRKRKSEKMLRTISASTESLRQRNALGELGGVTKRLRSSSGSKQLLSSAQGDDATATAEGQRVGVLAFRERMRIIRSRKAEKAAEKRRAELRGKIGSRVYHMS